MAWMESECLESSSDGRAREPITLLVFTIIPRGPGHGPLLHQTNST